MSRDGDETGNSQAWDLEYMGHSEVRYQLQTYYYINITYHSYFNSTNNGIITIMICFVIYYIWEGNSKL